MMVCRYILHDHLLFWWCFSSMGSYTYFIFLVRDETRYCNSCRTLVCGGYGELVRIESSFCCGLFKRGRFGVPCAPVFCPDMCCPCLVKSELWVEDAKSAVQIITMARDNARSRMDMHESWFLLIYQKRLERTIAVHNPLWKYDSHSYDTEHHWWGDNIFIKTSDWYVWALSLIGPLNSIHN